MLQLVLAVSRAGPNQVKKVGQVVPHGAPGRRAHPHIPPEQVLHREFYPGGALTQPITHRAGGPQSLQHRLTGAHALQHCVGAYTFGQLLDAGDALVAPFGQDVGGAALAAPRGVDQRHAQVERLVDHSNGRGVVAGGLPCRSGTSCPCIPGR